MKLWEKNYEVNKEIDRFTVGRDREMDLYLAKYDVLGSSLSDCWKRRNSPNCWQN